MTKTKGATTRVQNTDPLGVAYKYCNDVDKCISYFYYLYLVTQYENERTRGVFKKGWDTERSGGSVDHWRHYAQIKTSYGSKNKFYHSARVRFSFICLFIQLIHSNEYISRIVNLSFFFSRSQYKKLADLAKLLFAREIEVIQPKVESIPAVDGIPLVKTSEEAESRADPNRFQGGKVEEEEYKYEYENEDGDNKMPIKLIPIGRGSSPRTPRRSGGFSKARESTATDDTSDTPPPPPPPPRRQEVGFLYGPDEYKWEPDHCLSKVKTMNGYETQTLTIIPMPPEFNGEKNAYNLTFKGPTGKLRLLGGNSVLSDPSYHASWFHQTYNTVTSTTCSRHKSEVDSAKDFLYKSGSDQPAVFKDKTFIFKLLPLKLSPNNKLLQKFDIFRMKTIKTYKQLLQLQRKRHNRSLPPPNKPLIWLLPQLVYDSKTKQTKRNFLLMPIK